MSTEVHNIIARLKAMGASQAARELEKFSGAVNTGTKSLSQMQLIGGVTAGMLVRDLAQGFIRAAKEGVVMAGQFQTAQTGFERLTARFDEGVISLESLRKATKNTVNDLDLLQTANKAVALGLPVERMNELFDIASKLGPLMGRTVTEAVNDLALGIGRQSRMILDNLGIVISVEEANETYATTLGKVASELTKVERDQAFLNATLVEGTRVTNQVGDAMSEQQEVLLQSKAAWDNLKIAIGEATGHIIIYGYRSTQVLQETIAGAREHRQALEDLAKPIPSGWIITHREELDRLSRTIENQLLIQLRTSISTLDSVRQSFEEFDFILDTTASTIEDVSTAMGDDSVDAFTKAMEASKAYAQQLRDVVTAQEEAREEARKGLVDRLRAEDEERARGFLDPLEDALDASRRSSSELNLEMMKLDRSLRLGTITQETYDKEAKRIRDTLADLRIKQQELRFAIDDTTAAILAQGRAFQGLPPPVDEGAGPLSFDYTQYAPLATGVAGAGGQQFQVMAIGGQRGAATTTTITINLTGEQIVGKTAAEIRELARKLADEMIKELRRQGVTP